MKECKSKGATPISGSFRHTKIGADYIQDYLRDALTVRKNHCLKQLKSLMRGIGKNSQG